MGNYPDQEKTLEAIYKGETLNFVRWELKEGDRLNGRIYIKKGIELSEIVVRFKKNQKKKEVKADPKLRAPKHDEIKLVERDIHCEKYSQCLDLAARKGKRMVCSRCNPGSVNFEKPKEVESE
jgi:hypothetical protein